MATPPSPLQRGGGAHGMNTPFKMVSLDDCTHDHETEICGCGIPVGEMQVRGGLLIAVGDGGRLHCRAPRNADVNLARRVVATMAHATKLGEVEALVANLTSIREKA